MLENAARVWKLSLRGEPVEINFPDTSSLDAITRRLPQGYYSTFRTFGGGKRALGLQAHLQRLYRPASLQNIKPSVPVALLRRHLSDILQEYFHEARVRMIMTGNGQVYIAIETLKPLPPEIYLHGVKVITLDVQRDNPRVKSTAFITRSENIRTQIAHSEVFEALLMRKNSILEGMTSNFFYVMDGALGTARNEILLGVTRRTVLRVIRESGLSIVYRPMKQEQVSALSEAFLTSSSRGIVPIIRIDDITVGEGHPGSATKRLSNAYAQYVEDHAEVIQP